MDLSHIAHWIQREDDELLGYAPFDEGSGLEDNAAVPEPDPWPYDEGTP